MECGSLRYLRLLSSLDVLGVCLAPCGETAFQGVDLGHIVAQSSQDIGGSLSVTLTGVADQDQSVVHATGSNLHGSNASSEVAFLTRAESFVCCWARNAERAQALFFPVSIPG